MRKKIFSHTTALCPDCGNKVSARIIEKEKKIFLEKFCQEHGLSLVMTCSDADWYRESLGYIKPPQKPLSS